MNLWFHFWPFSLLLVILTNLRPQRSELIARFWLFPRICDQKGMNVLPDFCLFSRICEQKEVTYLSRFLTAFTNLKQESNQL